MLILILFGPSLLGLLLVVSSCFQTRRLGWLIAALVAGVLLHLVSAVIQSQPLPYGEPSSEKFAEAQHFAHLYFYYGLPVLVAPILIKLLYVYIRSSKRAA